MVNADIRRFLSTNYCDTVSLSPPIATEVRGGGTLDNILLIGAICAIAFGCVNLTVPLYALAYLVCFVVGFIAGWWVRTHAQR